MINNNSENPGNHLSEQQFIDYVQQRILPPELQILNMHLVNCSECAEKLAEIILFAVENRLFETSQQKEIAQLFHNSINENLPNSIFSRFLSNFKPNCWSMKRQLTRHSGINFGVYIRFI